MKSKIHRGTQEIGGSCIEVWTDSTKILIDIGMPLVNPDGTEFDSRQVETNSVEELIKNGILPNIPDLYHPDKKNTIDAVLISHPHQDHYGLGDFVDKSIPFYLGEDAHNLIDITRLFIGRGLNIQRPIHIEDRVPVTIGDIEITPYLNDHSGFDAYSFLVKGNGETIFYTGDFRAHGRKKKLFNWIINDPPKNIDYLLMEGTNLGIQDKSITSEENIERQLITAINNCNGLTLVYVSGQNIDRIVSIYRAAKRAGKTLILDIYTAYVLYILSKNHPKLPNSEFSNIKVLFSKLYPTKYYMIRLKRNGMDNILDKLGLSAIYPNQIDSNPSKFVMLARPGFEKETLPSMRNIDGGTFIYSLWHGYLEKDRNKSFITYLEGRDFKIEKIHTSGHADLKTLQKLVNALKPKCIIPIHTFNAEDYEKHFSYPVRELNDGEVLSF